MTERFYYRQGNQGATLRLYWDTQTGTPRDLTGATSTAVLEGSDGVDNPVTGTITGGDGYVDVAWSTTDLDVAPDTYKLKVDTTVGGVPYSWSPGDWPLVVIDD